MSPKTYKLSKTAKKTAKENNLVKPESLSNTVQLFDFSLLDKMAISEAEKETLMNDAMKHVTGAFPDCFYGKEIDNFTTFSGIASFYVHHVYSKDGKHLYNILELAAVDHCHKTRNSIYDDYSAEEIKAHTEYGQPLTDYEI